MKKKTCLASECKTENLENFDRDGLTYFKDLIEEASMPSSFNMILKKYYDPMICNKGELDESLFINEDYILLASTGSVKLRMGMLDHDATQYRPSKCGRGMKFFYFTSEESTSSLQQP